MSAGTGQPAEGHAASGSPDLSQDDWQGLKTELGAARHRIAQLENTVEMVLTRLYALERAAVDDEDVHGGQLPGSAALAGSSKRTRIKPLPPVSPVLQYASGQQPEAHGQQPHQDGVYASQRRQSSVRFNQVAPERSNAARIQWPENTLSSLTSPVAGLRKSRSSNGSEHPHGVDGDKGTSVQPEQRQGHALAPGKRFRSAVQDSTGPTLRQSQVCCPSSTHEKRRRHAALVCFWRRAAGVCLFVWVYGHDKSVTDCAQCRGSIRFCVLNSLHRIQHKSLGSRPMAAIIKFLSRAARAHHPIAQLCRTLTSQ